MGNFSIINMGMHRHKCKHYYLIHVLKTNKNKKANPFIGSKTWDISMHSTCTHDIPSSLAFDLGE